MIEELTTRQMQIECARALSSINCDSGTLSKYNKLAHHNSLNWYIAVIKDYVQKWGDLPSRVGPAKDVRMLLDV